VRPARALNPAGSSLHAKSPVTGTGPWVRDRSAADRTDLPESALP